MIQLRHIQVFLAVYREANISRAACALHTSQPAVSRTIREIEDEYGVDLFERSGNRIAATETGKRFYLYASQINESFRNLEKGLLTWEENKIIRIGASPTMGTTFLPELVMRMREQYRTLRIEVSVLDGGSVYQMLNDGEIDFAFLEGAEMVTRTSQYRSLELPPDRMVVILPPGHPLAEKQDILPEDLVHTPFLLRGMKEQQILFIRSIFADANLPFHPLWRCESIQTLIQAVHAGVGISVVPDTLVRHELNSGYLVGRDISGVAMDRKNYLIWKAERKTTGAEEALLSLAATMSETARNTRGR